MQNASKVVETAKIFPTSFFSTDFDIIPRQNDPYKFPMNPIPLARYRCHPMEAKVKVRIWPIFEMIEIIMIRMSDMFSNRFNIKSPTKDPTIVNVHVTESYKFASDTDQLNFFCSNRKNRLRVPSGIQKYIEKILTEISFFSNFQTYEEQNRNSTE